MTRPDPAADADTAQLLQTLDAMAKRLKAEFVPDDDKVRAFSAAAAKLRRRTIAAMQAQTPAD